VSGFVISADLTWGMLPRVSSYLLINLIYFINELLELWPVIIKQVEPYSSLSCSCVTITFNKYPKIQLLIIYQGSNKILGIG